MFCTNCGAKVVEGSAHCTSCGTRMDGLGAVGSAARNAYAGMDETLKRSLLLGGGSMLASLLGILLLAVAEILLILFIPAAMTLGIMALNAGRNLDNRAGYYLGMIGLTSSVVMLYLSLIGYAAMSMAQAAAQSAMGSMFQ